MQIVLMNIIMRLMHRYTAGILDLRHLDPCMGLNLGVVFLVIKIIVVCQVRVLPACTAGIIVKTNTRKTLRGVQRSWTHLFCIHAFAYVVGKNPKTPKLSPMADIAITQGGSGKRGISGVYLWVDVKRGYVITQKKKQNSRGQVY